MDIERNLDYLNRRRIIYRRNPVDDEPSETYDWGWFYKTGTHGCYTLFASKAKVTTYKSLKWHLYVLWYLNPQLDQEDFDGLTEFICDKKHGFITFDVPSGLRHSIAYEVSLSDLDRPPPNKLRKVIFKDNCKLELKEKLSIVGHLIGRKCISENEIYDVMLMLHDDKKRITIKNLASSLECSERTIYRNMSNELKKEKELLNNQL
mgnify:CR=1 FL=1|jgi:hypothetical protein